jgi:hypothetical protein
MESVAGQDRPDPIEAQPPDRPPRGVLIAALLFNLGQGVLRPSLPLLVMGTLADAVHLTTPFVCAALLVFVLAWLCHREAVAESSASEASA